MKHRGTSWGGGSQFVEFLSSRLRLKGHYVTYNLEKNLDCILIVKHWRTKDTRFDIRDIQRYKSKNPSVFCLHRINECDKRKGTEWVDEALKKANTVSDYTVFVSEWLKDYSAQRWFNPSLPNGVVYNGADPQLFFPETDKGDHHKVPFRIVTHHWSDNWKKGFGVYQELDKKIAEGSLRDCELTVIGRWPRKIRWRAAKTVKSVKGKHLADILRANHAYLTASLWEPCGMHYIEGVQCGLPLLYHLDGGGVVEFGEKYGIGFREDMDAALSALRNQYEKLRDKIIQGMPTGIKMSDSYEKIFLNRGAPEKY